MSVFPRSLYDKFDLTETPPISTVTLKNVKYDIELPQHVANLLMDQLVDPDVHPLDHFRIKRHGSVGYKSIINTTTQCDTEANLRKRLEKLAIDKTSLQFPVGSHCKLSDDTTLNLDERPKKWSDVLNNDYSLVICCMHRTNCLLNYSLNDANIRSLMVDLGAPYPCNIPSSSDQPVSAVDDKAKLSYTYKSDDVVTIGSYVTNGHNDAEYSRRLWELLGGMNPRLY